MSDFSNDVHHADSDSPETKQKDFRVIKNHFHPVHSDRMDGFYYDNLIIKLKEAFEQEPQHRMVMVHGGPGSGKSMTFKKLEKDPGRIGAEYMVVHIDTRSFCNLSLNDVILNLFNDLAARLGGTGLVIHPGYFSHKPDFAELLLNLEAAILPDMKLMLVFDEFDTFLNNMEGTVLSDFINLLMQLGKKWEQYTVVLVLDKKFSDVVSSNPLNGLLSQFAVIDMDDKEFEDSLIHKMIVDPLKGQVEFEIDAIRKIIWYSGKHHHFLHLIGSYLIDYLNEKKQTYCRKTDVERVIKRILKETRSEFNFAWEELDAGARLVVSALADETVTKQSARYFFVENDGLLNALFEEDIYTVLKRLRGFCHILPIDGKRFLRYPFQYPIYGKWIQKRHPFLKTIIEQVDEIADQLDIDVLKKKIESSSNLKLMSNNRSFIISSLTKWMELKNIVGKKRNMVSRQKVMAFLKPIFNLVGIKIIEVKDKGIPANYFVIDISSLNIGLLREGYFFYQDRPQLTGNDISYIENVSTSLTGDGTSKLAVFFYFHEVEGIQALVKKPYLNLVPIGENDVKAIILSERPYNAFRRSILKKISIRKISPYHTSGPAKSLFYGRSDTIQQIISASDINYSIVGARKIGKSSLLNKIRDHSPPDTKCVFMDLQGQFSDVDDYGIFLESFAEELAMVFEMPVNFNNDVFRIFSEVRRLTDGGKRKTMFILDEIDDLIAFDEKRGYKLIRTLRRVAQAKYCRIIVAGFKMLYHGRRAHDSPFYNFCEEILLGHLKDDVALELMTEPMNNIGVHFERPEDRLEILRYTSGHPNLIQFFGKSLGEIIEGHHHIEDRRTIFLKDIEEVLGTKYEDYIIDDIYMFFSDLEELNKLIVILMVEVHDQVKAFDCNFMKGKLAEVGIVIDSNEVFKKMQELVMRFFLLRANARNLYSFALPIFPNMLKKRLDDDFKKNLINDLLSQNKGEE